METQDTNSEIVITASYEDYQAFVCSLLWNDLRTELTTQREMVIEALGRAEGIQVYRLQGQLEACNDFLSMPMDFIRLLEDRFSKTQIDSGVADHQDESESDAYYTQMLENFKE